MAKRVNEYGRVLNTETIRKMSRDELEECLTVRNVDFDELGYSDDQLRDYLMIALAMEGD